MTSRKVKVSMCDGRNKKSLYPGQIILRRTLIIERLSYDADALKQAEQDQTTDDRPI